MCVSAVIKSKSLSKTIKPTTAFTKTSQVGVGVPAVQAVPSQLAGSPNATNQYFQPSSSMLGPDAAADAFYKKSMRSQISQSLSLICDR